MVRKPSEIIRGARKKAAKKRTKRKAKKLKKKRKKRRLKKKAVAKAEPVTSRVRSVADEASSTKREAKKLSDEVGLSGAGQSTGNVLDSASGAIDAARETLDDIEAGSSANNSDILDAVEGSQTDASFEATIDDGGMAIEEGGFDATFDIGPEPDGDIETDSDIGSVLDGDLGINGGDIEDEF